MKESVDLHLGPAKEMKERVMKITVVPDGEPIFSVQAVHVSIEDEAAGEYVFVERDIDQGKDGVTGFAIDPDEWPAIRAAIDRMIAECRSKWEPL